MIISLAYPYYFFNTLTCFIISKVLQIKARVVCIGNYIAVRRDLGGINIDVDIIYARVWCIYIREASLYKLVRKSVILRKFMRQPLVGTQKRTSTVSGGGFLFGERNCFYEYLFFLIILYFDGQFVIHLIRFCIVFKFLVFIFINCVLKKSSVTIKIGLNIFLK